MGREYEFAELIVSRKTLEAFPASSSPYQIRKLSPEVEGRLDAIRR